MIVVFVACVVCECVQFFVAAGGHSKTQNRSHKFADTTGIWSTLGGPETV